jgi:hypothetical protein
MDTKQHSNNLLRVPARARLLIIHRSSLATAISLPKLPLRKSLVLFGSRNVTQRVMIMVYIRLPSVTSLNSPVSNFSIVSDYSGTKTNMI